VIFTIVHQNFITTAVLGTFQPELRDDPFIARFILQTRLLPLRISRRKLRRGCGGDSRPI